MSSSLPVTAHDDWLLTPQRAAVHRPTATAVIADLHLGYDHVRRRSGEALPDFSSDETLIRLETLAANHSIRRLIIAGDLCESSRCTGPVAGWLQGLARLGIELAGVVPGNHDRGLPATDGLPLHADGITLGRWQVVHGDGRLPRGPIVHGHWHPCLRWGGHGAAPCFLLGPRRLVLPAFSADAAGVNVLRRKEWRSYRCCVVVGASVLDFGTVQQLRSKAQNKK